MRNISFALTTRQIRERTKTVTRRRGTWWAKILKPGDLLCAVEKSQGIKKGGLVRLGVIRVVSVRVESLWEITAPDNLERYGAWGRVETQREGFVAMDGVDFVKIFTDHMGGAPSQPVTRIEFEYVDEAPSGAGGAT